MMHYLVNIKWWCLYALAAVVLGIAGAFFGSQYLFAGLIVLACAIVIAFNPVAGM